MELISDPSRVSVQHPSEHCAFDINFRLQNLIEKSSEISISLERINLQIIQQEWEHSSRSEFFQDGEIPCNSNTLMGEFKQRVEAVITELEIIQSRILFDELPTWKLEQRRLRSTHVTSTKKIDFIEGCLDDLVEIILKTQHQIQESAKFYNPLVGGFDASQNYILQSRIKSLLAEIVRNSLVVEAQPCQVIKMQTRLPKPVILRFIAPSLFRHLRMDLSKSENQPEVEMSILTETHLCSISASELKPHKTSGDLQRNMARLESKRDSKSVYANYRNVQLKKIYGEDRRASAPRTETVTDLKFCLHFYCSFNAGGFEFKTSVISDPVVVITHGVQESQAWATINWDNAFAEPNRVPFVVPHKVSWAQLSEMLKSKFMSTTGGHGLTEDNLKYLEEKIFWNVKTRSRVITWMQFCKSIPPDRNVAFWDWFYAAMKVVEKNARNLWNDKSILGFIGKVEAEELLSSSPHGTFVIRFSDTISGGLSIAFVDVGENGKNVRSIAPFTAKQLQLKSLPNVIKDLNELKFLYPATPKDDAFSKYYTRAIAPVIPASRGPGYISPLLRYVLSTPDELKENPQIAKKSSGSSSSPLVNIYQKPGGCYTPPHSSRFISQPLEPVEMVEYMETGSFDDNDNFTNVLNL